MLPCFQIVFVGRFHLSHNWCRAKGREETTRQLFGSGVDCSRLAVVEKWLGQSSARRRKLADRAGIFVASSRCKKQLAAGWNVVERILFARRSRDS